MTIIRAIIESFLKAMAFYKNPPTVTYSITHQIYQLHISVAEVERDLHAKLWCPENPSLLA